MTKSSLNNSKQSSNIKSRLFMSIWKLKILHSVKCLPRQFKDVQQHKSNTHSRWASFHCYTSEKQQETCSSLFYVLEPFEAEADLGVRSKMNGW